MMNKFVLAPAAGAADTRARGLTVKSRRLHGLLTFLMVAGPGLIVMEADNDAGAVSTYVQAGAQYGTRLLWVLLLLRRSLTSCRRWWCVWASPRARATRP
jgi:hypothetical protein